MKPGFLLSSLYVACVLTASCGRSAGPPSDKDKPAKLKPTSPTKPEFRLPAQKAGFKTAFAMPNEMKAAPTKPPAEVFALVQYPAPLGNNAAYVTPIREGERRPAIVWIHGGFNFGIGSSAWESAPRENDQSASAFREAGLVLMIPSLRGTNNNPGNNECFLGEVEDVIAAGKYLLTRPDVDPKRIYLGGHSTGGTMVLLAAVSTEFFRGVFAFGPALSVLSYGDDSCVPASATKQEAMLRTPAYFFKDVKTPTFLVEGSRQGNGPYDVSSELVGKAPISTTIVPGATHFSVLRPGSEVVAAAILSDTEEQSNIRITADAIANKLRVSPPKPVK